jgi:hypothetical protein
MPTRVAAGRRGRVATRLFLQLAVARNQQALTFHRVQISLPITARIKYRRAHFKSGVALLGTEAIVHAESYRS